MFFYPLFQGWKIMKAQSQPEEKLPEIAKKYLDAAVGGIIISSIELALRVILPDSADKYVKLLSNILLLLLVVILFLRPVYLKSFLYLQRWKAWRMVNSMIILFVFFAPWFRACTPTPVPPDQPNQPAGFSTIPEVVFNGYQIIYLTGAVTLDKLLSRSVETFLDAIPWAVIFFGLLFMIIYSFANLRIIFTNGRRRLLVFSLVMSFLGLLSMAFSVTNKRDLLWGYWLGWVGLTSSAVLEILSRREHKKMI
jgi:hypothetical protein